MACGAPRLGRRARVQPAARPGAPGPLGAPQAPPAALAGARAPTGGNGNGVHCAARREGPVAQGIERSPPKRQVAGSNPAGVARPVRGIIVVFDEMGLVGSL
jgi:hypothetical protein